MNMESEINKLLIKISAVAYSKLIKAVLSETYIFEPLCRITTNVFF